MFRLHHLQAYGVIRIGSKSGKGEGINKIKQAIKNAASNRAGYRLMAFDVNEKGVIAQSLGIKTAHAFGIVYASNPINPAVVQNPWNKGNSEYSRAFKLPIDTLYKNGRFLVIEDTK